MARALTNFVFVKPNLFPLVVHREDRVEYLAALEAADEGDLRPLIDLFADVQARTLLDALSVAKDEEEHGKRTALDTVVGKLTERFGQRIQDRRSVLRSVNEIAAQLRDGGAAHLTASADKAVTEMNRRGAALRVYHDRGGLDHHTEHFWKLQLVEIANEHSYWINFSEGQYWLRIAINGGPVEFRYIASLHHVGHDLTGAMRASAFAEFEVPNAPESDGRTAEPTNRLRQSCTPTLFSFTWQSEPDALVPVFRTWLEESFAMGLRRWMDLF